MQHGGEVRWDTVGVGIDEHVVVEPVDRVVQRRCVQPDPDTWMAGVWPVVGQQHIADLRGYGVADVFLLAAQRDLWRIRVAKQDPDRGPVVGLLLQQLDLVYVLLGEEEAGVNQDADLIDGVSRRGGVPVGSARLAGRARAARAVAVR